MWPWLTWTDCALSTVGSAGLCVSHPKQDPLLERVPNEHTRSWINEHSGLGRRERKGDSLIRPRETWQKDAKRLVDLLHLSSEKKAALQALHASAGRRRGRDTIFVRGCNSHFRVHPSSSVFLQAGVARCVQCFFGLNTT